MRLIIAGGRDFNDYTLLCNEVNKLIEGSPTEVEIVSGCAKGADDLGLRFAAEHHLTIVEFPAKWKDLKAEPCSVRSNQYGQYNALAGLNRNIDMAKYADVLIAFWDGKSRGTKHMIDTALEHKLEVIVINYE